MENDENPSENRDNWTYIAFGLERMGDGFYGTVYGGIVQGDEEAYNVAVVDVEKNNDASLFSSRRYTILESHKECYSRDSDLSLSLNGTSFARTVRGARKDACGRLARLAKEASFKLGV